MSNDNTFKVGDLILETKHNIPYIILRKERAGLPHEWDYLSHYVLYDVVFDKVTILTQHFIETEFTKVC